MKFHNGKEVDAEDVKYTYNRVRDPKVSPGANDLFFIKQIDVVDRFTVRFLLSAPVTTFLINLAGKYNGVIPKGARGDGKELLLKAIGTGPFAVAWSTRIAQTTGGASRCWTRWSSRRFRTSPRLWRDCAPAR